MNKEELEEKIKITKEDREKNLAMWAGVVFFMILIIFLWFLNTKKVFTRVALENKNQNFNVNEAQEKLNKSLVDLREELSAMTKQADIASTSQDEIAIDKTNEDINKESIEALRERLEASSSDNIYEKEQ